MGSFLLFAEKQQFEGELVRLIENHRSFPSVIMYVVFNEGWGQYEVSPLCVAQMFFKAPFWFVYFT